MSTHKESLITNSHVLDVSNKDEENESEENIEEHQYMQKVKIAWFLALVFFAGVLFCICNKIESGTQHTLESLISYKKEGYKTLVLPHTKEKRIRINGNRVILDYSEWSEDLIRSPEIASMFASNVCEES